MKWLIGLALGMATAFGAQAAEMTIEEACEKASIIIQHGSYDYREEKKSVADFAKYLSKDEFDLAPDESKILAVSDNSAKMATLLYDDYALYFGAGLSLRFDADCKTKNWDFRPLVNNFDFKPINAVLDRAKARKAQTK